MAWTRYQFSLAALMVFTGSINTLTTKWADEIKSVGEGGGDPRPFEHPFFQACCMFLGEILCLVTFKVLYHIFSRRNDGSENVHELTKGNRDFNPFLLFFPAMCDMTATSIMYIGLNLTYASSFQMLRGSVIIFVGLLSVGFLQRVLKKLEWTGMVLVIIGLATVGAADFLTPDTNSGDNHNSNDIITGDLLIIIAQVIQSLQMVVEEKYVAGQDIPPLQAVGWEGIFGFTVLVALQLPFYFIKAGPPFTNNPTGRLEDPIDAFVQITNNMLLLLPIMGTILSIAFFNFAGISVTKELSATTRMVLDSVRTLVIWVFSLWLFGQKFHWLQLIGFIFLIWGMCLYNGITLKPQFLKLKQMIIRRRTTQPDEEEIINEVANE